MEQHSAAHVAAIVAMVAAAAVLVRHARRNAGEPSLCLTRALALVIGSAYLVEHTTHAARGVWTVSANLPFHLSDVVTFVAVAALWRPQTPPLVEALYFWAFSTSLQAVVSPGIGASFPDVLHFTYFVIHAGAVVAGCLLVFGYRRVPRGAVFRVLVLTVSLAMVAGAGQRGDRGASTCSCGLSRRGRRSSIRWVLGRGGSWEAPSWRWHPSSLWRRWPRCCGRTSSAPDRSAASIGVQRERRAPWAATAMTSFGDG